MASDHRALHNTLLGYHDGEAFTILLASHDDPAMMRITDRHEFIHHVLFSGTTYGQLVRRIKRDRGEVEPVRHAQVMRQLMDDCRSVQEMLATYVSITEARRRDLVDTLPPLYRDVFDRCVRMVEREFNAGVPRRAYAIAIARCAMMTRPGNEIAVEVLPQDRGVALHSHPENQVVDDFVAGRRIALPDDMLPDRRLTVIEGQLLALPMGIIRRRLRERYRWLEPAVNSNTVHELEKALDRHRERTQEALIDLHWALMIILVEQLENSLPGLSSNYRTGKMVRGMESVRRTTGFDDAQLNNLELIWDSAAQTVKVADGPLPSSQRVPRGRHGIIQVGKAMKEMDVGYAYVIWRPTSQKFEVYLTSMMEGPIRKMRCFLLGEEDIPQLFAWQVTPPWLKWVTVVEEADLRHLSDGQLGAAMFHTVGPGCFVHMSGSPIRYLLQLMNADYKVKWTAVNVINTLAPHRRTNLQIVFYAVQNYANWLFHLSNPSLTTAVERFTDLIADAARLQYLPLETQPADFPADQIALLGGHPVVSMFYTLGGTPDIP